MWESGGLASSWDGIKLAAVPNFGYIYTSSDSGVTWIEHTQINAPTVEYLTGDQAAAIELQYIGKGQFRILSREGTFEVH
jgi:hypothetical protein